MPKAVIFDVDGTLIDSNDLHAAAWVEAFKHFGFEIPFQAVRHQMGKGADQLMPMFLRPDVLQREGERIDAYRREICRRDYLPRAQPFPGVKHLFEKIKKAGQTIVLATSSSRSELDRQLQKAGIADLIDAATTADDAEHSKPAPDIFAAALKQIEPIKPAQAIVVGDTPYDVEAAAKLGLKTVGLLCGGFAHHELLAAGCVAIYQDPADLLQHYDSSPLHGS